MLLKKSFYPILFLGVVCIFLNSCEEEDVARVNSDMDTDLSGRWNDTDVRKVSELSTKMIPTKWLNEFKMKNSIKPVMIVGDIKNKTDEHIDTSTFLNDIESVLLKEETICIIANEEFRTKLREERIGQEDYTNPATQKKMKNELGADVMLMGSIVSMVDTKGDDNTIKIYKVNLQLIDLETHEKIASENVNIKKLLGKGKKLKKFKTKDKKSIKKANKIEKIKKTEIS